MKVPLYAVSSDCSATRLRPAAPSNLQRKTPPEGMMVGGRFVPGNVHMHLNGIADPEDYHKHSNLCDFAR